MTMNVTDPFARTWLRKDDNGRAWAKSMGFDRPVFFTPERECNADDPHATLKITNINDGDTLKDERIVVNVVAWATGGFDRWHLDSAPGDNPGDGDWGQLFQSGQQVKDPTDVYTWVLSKAGKGKVSLRLRMENKDGGYAERVLHVKIDYNPPTATPAPIPTETEVPPPTRTRRPNTPVPTDTSIPPTDVPVPTNTPVPPTDVPVPTDTSVPPTDVPAPTDTPAPAP
jgi:hypothetical protein